MAFLKAFLLQWRFGSVIFFFIPTVLRQQLSVGLFHFGTQALQQKGWFKTRHDMFGNARHEYRNGSEKDWGWKEIKCARLFSSPLDERRVWLDVWFGCSVDSRVLGHFDVVD